MKLFFASDYQEGAHEIIMRRLNETNLKKTAGYGLDEYSESARGKIRRACAAPEAEIHFLIGGTQTNAVVIDAMLRSYQGVLASKTGHISVHEAGAIEYGGHKVMELPHEYGKLSPQSVEEAVWAYRNDANRDHMVMPGMVYISQPTEYGTLYSLAELEALSEVCRRCALPLYVDGARLAYALACRDNDVTLADLARLTDAFYIGGTKCGALFGEALVFPRPATVPHFFTIVKQHGALMAKGRLLGVQFDSFFEDGLYFKIGKHAVDAADRIRLALKEHGYRLHFESPTNQIFVILSKEQYREISAKAELAFWEVLPDGDTVMRIATSWGTADEDVDRLVAILADHR